MRIPSEFNEDSLYRRGGHRDQTAQSYRRLIRLVLGLVLVIFVMGQASRVEIYETFFGPNAATPPGAVQSPNKAPLAGGPTLLAAPVTPEDRKVAKELTEHLRPSDQRQWVVALSRWQRRQSVQSVPSTVESIRDQLASMEISQERRMAWEVAIDAFVKGASIKTGGQVPAATTVDDPCVAAFLAALDEAAAARVVDGSVWRAGDFDSFYRCLDQAPDLPVAGVATTGVLPLLQQPDVFRNQLVRVHGGVARAEQIDAKENPYGIEDYWQLWLRPADGADRPLVAVVPEVPPVVLQAVGSDAVLDEGPRVTVVGRFLKRLAYQSAIGADLAPVVVGRISSAPPSGTDGSAKRDRTPDHLWLTIPISCLIGLALAVLALWRTSVSAQRARQLRQSHQRKPDAFLKDLGNTPDHAAAENHASDKEV